MLIDLHVHTAKYSDCSSIDLERAVIKAKEIGLDGICVTDHNSLGMLKGAHKVAQSHNFLVLVGVEVLTYEGDILVFGLEEIPKKKLHAQELIDLVNQNNGAAIAAHPFREFSEINRGVGEDIKKFNGLSGIEAFNGNTKDSNNYQAYNLARELDIPCLGASDAHKIKEVGKYATFFQTKIKNIEDLIRVIKDGVCYPVRYEDDFKEIEV